LKALVLFVNWMYQETTMSPGWNVLNDAAYGGEQGFVRVLGEIYNNTGSRQENVLVIISFYDDLGRKVAEEPVPPVVEVVPQGIKVPFDLETELRTPYARYEIRVESSETDRQPRMDLEVVDHSVSGGEPYVITGEIHNPGDPLSAYAEIIATLYDATGRVMGVGYAFLSASELGPGQTRPFDVIADKAEGSVASYTLLALGF